MAKHYIISSQQITLIRATLGPLPGLACDPIIGVLDQLRPYDQGIVTTNDATGDADLDHLTSMVKEIHEAIVNPTLVPDTAQVTMASLPLKKRTLKFEDQEVTEAEDDFDKELQEVDAIPEEDLEGGTSVDMVIPVDSEASMKKAKRQMNKANKEAVHT